MSQPSHEPARPTELRRRLQLYIADLAFELGDEARRQANAVTMTAAQRGFPSAGRIYQSQTDLPMTQLGQVIKLALDWPPAANILCAFGSVHDCTCTLHPRGDGPGRVAEWVDDHSRHWPHTERAEDVKKTLVHPLDIRRMIEVAFANEDGKSAGGKSTVATPQLRDAILVGALPDGPHPFPFERTSLGGAPAIISKTLSDLGVSAAFYAVYHSPEMAKLFDEATCWLDANDPQLTAVNARGADRPSHPTRHGYALAYLNGTYPDFFGGIEAQRADRQLLVLKPPATFATTRPWQTWSLSGVIQAADRDLGPTEWPVPPGFVWWGLNGDHLAMEPIGDGVLQELGQTYDLVITSVPQLGEVKDESALNGEKMRQLRKQFEALAGGGACLHLELSGEAGGTTLKIFGLFLRGVIASIGINSDELAGYARLALGDLNRELSAAAQKNPSSPLARYEQALALACALDVDRLYVHGNDVDILVRRTDDVASMYDEMRADLYAKIVVLVATILRNPSEVAGKIELPLHLTEGTVNALHAIEASEGAGGLEIPAREFAAEPKTLETAHWDVRRLQGALCPRPPQDGYRVALVPTIWIKPPQGFSSTGAGDITSGVSFVYSGYHKPRVM